ncbi:MAG TPA: acyl carrier protein [Streptosporangiaceae bacterium]
MTVVDGEPVKDEPVRNEKVRDEKVIRAHVREVLLELAPVQDPPDKPVLELEADLGYNSLALLEAVVALEEELGLILIDDGSVASITTVADVEDYVVRLAQLGEG